MDAFHLLPRFIRQRPLIWAAALLLGAPWVRGIGPAGRQVLFVVNTYTGTIGEYDANTGATINASFIAGINGPENIVVSGSTLYVTVTGTGRVATYNTNTGALLNANFIVGSFGFIPVAMAVAGSDLVVTTQGTISEVSVYNLTTGAPVTVPLSRTTGSYPDGAVAAGTTAFVTNEDLGHIDEFDTTTGVGGVLIDEGLGVAPYGIVIAGSNLLIANGMANTISAYTTGGATVSASFITGLNAPWGLALNANTLYVANYANGLPGTGTIGAYNATSGAAINTAFVTNLAGPEGLAFATVAVDHFVVSAPTTATPGTAFNFTVTAQDASDNTVTSYTGPVHFTSSDGLATLPADSALVGGTGTFSATLNTIGTQTVSVNDSTVPSVTGTSASIVVSAAPAATHFSVSAPASATAGAAFNFTLTALDASNHTVVGYAGTVHFTASDGTAVLPADATLTAGTGTFSATLNTAGNQTLTATDTVTSAITGTSGSIAVTAAAATHFSVSAPASATADTAFNFTVTALDAFNNTVAGYAGTVHFTATDGSAVLPANASLTAGTGIFSATLKSPGNQTLTATDTVTSAITGTSGSIAVTAAPATHFSVSAPGSATAAAAFNYTVTALDAFNDTVVGYAGTVHFTSSDGSATLPANTTLTAGTGTFSATLKTASSQTLTATDTVTSSITGASGSIVVTAAAATHFSVSAPASATTATAFNFTVTALDVFNNAAHSYAGTVHFTSSDGSATLPADTTLTSGTGTLSATLRTFGSQAITATDTVTGSITGTSGAINVASPAPSPSTPVVFPVQRLVVSAPASVQVGVPFNVTVMAVNVLGVTATTFADVVHFSASDASGTLPANSTLTNGTGTFMVTLTTAGSQTIGVADTTSASISGNASVSVVDVPTHFQVQTPATATAGSSFSAVVTALDAVNRTVTAYSGTVHFSSSDPAASLPADQSIAGGSQGISARFATLGNQTLTATDKATPALTGTSPAVNVLAAGFPPTITVQPRSIGVGVGADAALWVVASGQGPFSYQWNFNGTPIAGATSSILIISNSDAANAGSYTVTITSPLGSTSSATATLTITPSSGTPPTFTIQPSSQTITPGSTIVFNVAALLGSTAFSSTVRTPAAAAAVTYQWFFNDVAVLGATDPTLVITNASAANSGAYTCLVTNPSGSVQSSPATLTIASTANPGRILNLSCLARTGAFLTGFLVGGAGTSGTDPVLLRASGPALSGFGVASALSDPQLTLRGAAGVIATNSGWAGSVQISTAAAAVGAFPWISASSHDAALVESLSPGAYYAQIAGASGDTGVTLAEIYDTSPASAYTASTPRLINLSATDQTGTGGNVLVAGFVIGGTTSKTVLLRASGPALAPFGIAGVLPDPQLQLYQANATGAATLLQQDSGWGGDPSIAATAAAVGAFSWGTAATADSALLLTLPPGAYSVQVTGTSGDAGVALVEVYDVP